MKARLFRTALAIFCIAVNATAYSTEAVNATAYSVDRAHALKACRALPAAAVKACVDSIAGTLKTLRVPRDGDTGAQIFSVPRARALAAASPTEITLAAGQSVTIRASGGDGVPVPPVVVDPPIVNPPVVDNCAVNGRTLNVALDWNNPNVRVVASGFGPNDVVVAQFTTGSVSSTSNLPNITAVEYGSTPSARTATLSAKPCDFGAQPAFGANMGGNTITAVFAVGTGSGFGFYPVLQTNTTYYLNIKNNPNAGCSAIGVCDMAIALSKSAGL